MILDPKIDLQKTQTVDSPIEFRSADRHCRAPLAGSSSFGRRRFPRIHERGRAKSRAGVYQVIRNTRSSGVQPFAQPASTGSHCQRDRAICSPNTTRACRRYAKAKHCRGRGENSRPSGQADDRYSSHTRSTQGEVTTGFHPFTLDYSTIHYQPVERDILIQYMRTNARETLSCGNLQREFRLEDYVVRGLMDFDDISYDTHADFSMT